MPNIGWLHPIVIHFTIGLLVAGVLFRLLSLLGRFKFAGPAAATLLIVGALSTLVAVRSGTDAHGPAERVPGARETVVEHEEWGERTRTLFLLIGGLEVAALAMRRHRHAGKLLAASALLGVVGLFFLYETGEHGGKLVYSYAGGVGTRTGEAADVENLLVAGLYHQAMGDRAAGDNASAARLIDELARRRPADTDVQLMRAESLLQDLGDVEGARAALQGIVADPDNRRLTYRRGLLEADILARAGDVEGARAALQALLEAFPGNATLQERLTQLR